MPELADDVKTLRRTWIVTSLAEYQSEFWIEICLHLKKLGQQVFALAFDDRSAEMFAAARIECSNIHAIGRLLVADNDIDVLFRHLCVELKVEEPNLMLSHERAAFRIRSIHELQTKFVRYALGASRAMRDLTARDEKPVMIQELGGFLSVLSAFYVAKNLGVHTFFIEPSFFRGRMFLQADTLKAPSVAFDADVRVNPVMREYLEQTLRLRQIVIPKKDRAHYNSVYSKIVNRRNAQRLIEKARDKYLLRKHQDFGYIGTHIATHLEMYRNSRALRTLYTALPDAGTYIYYPLHVPADVALTLRSPEYLDQLSLVDYLLRIIPIGYTLVIKEHPAQMGAVDIHRLRDLTKRYGNLRIVPPTLNNFAIIESAALVVSVNSKSGAEAMLLEKPVIVMGDAFYARTPFVTRVAALRDLPAAVRQSLTARPATLEEVAPYFQCVYEMTYPGELYVNDPENIETFSASLQVAIAEKLNVVKRAAIPASAL